MPCFSAADCPSGVCTSGACQPASCADMAKNGSETGTDCGGDCRPFAEVGLPTPVFRHDPLDYDTRTHHTNMDTYEHLIPADLRQAAVVVATMLYNTAMREEMLPRPAQPH